MRNYIYLIPMVIFCLTAQAQEDLRFMAKASPIYAGAETGREWSQPGVYLAFDQLEIAFSSGALTNPITWVNEAGTLLVQIESEPGHNRNVPARIVAIATDASQAGLTELMDGLVVANTGSQ
ncbi:MAG: hypothetical protein V4628_01535, partial [Pseudomonadota bacterium]